ncbi:hypothetical protein C8J57DRAFT_92392 [Mycena rebaudengoi]|nr:hypothetical protein C8J57DRAFT_92392 [Mycena rebaudengoi]
MWGPFCLNMPDNMDERYGAMLIGVMIATFFQGLLTLQAYVYYENFPNDSRKLKTLVASLWILDTAHLILISQTCYYYLISSWGDDTALLSPTKPFRSHLLFIFFTSALCQGFFLYRIWILSRKNWLLTGSLTAAYLGSVGFNLYRGAGVAVATNVTQFSTHKSQVILNYGIAALVDVAIAAMLVYYLLRDRTQFNRTNSVLGRIVQYTVATGLVTSLLAVAIIIAYVLRPKGYIHVAIHFSLGRIYTTALLASLNARKKLG